MYFHANLFLTIFVAEPEVFCTGFFFLGKTARLKLGPLQFFKSSPVFLSNLITGSWPHLSLDEATSFQALKNRGNDRADLAVCPTSIE